MKPRVHEVIVVEGRYDKNTVSQAVDAIIIETRGFGVFSDGELASLIREMAQSRGVILLTDSDGAGFVIRGHLKGMLNGVDVKNAYIPEISGREKRKNAPSKEGLLGVEGMSREIIIESLRRAGATFDTSALADRAELSKADMFSLGLSGTPNAAARRYALASRLGFPKLISPNAFFNALRCLYTRDELEAELAAALEHIG